MKVLLSFFFSALSAAGIAAAQPLSVSHEDTFVKADAQAVCRVALRNTGTEKITVRCVIERMPVSSQHARLAEELEVSPGVEAGRVVTLAHPMPLPEPTLTKIRVTSADGGTVYFEKSYTWNPPLPAVDAQGLMRVKSALCFHASFDEGFDARFAKGEAAGRMVSLASDSGAVLVDGLRGKALRSGLGGATVRFPCEGNLQARQGTLSMWVRPLDWKGGGAGDKSHGFFKCGREDKGYWGIQLARQYQPAPYLVFFMAGYAWRDACHIHLGEEAGVWASDQWHWLVITWCEDRLAVYIDGRSAGARALSPPLSDRDRTSVDFSIGKSGGDEATAIDEVMIFDRALSADEIRMARGFCRAQTAAGGWEDVLFDFAHYPYARKLKMRVDVSGMPGGISVRSGRVTLARADPDEAIDEIALPQFTNGLSEVIAEIPELADGRYRLSVRLEGAPGTLTGELRREFERRVFEWERNRIGMSDIIMEPFEPIRREGAVIRTVLREHTVNAQGLWEQVSAKGKNILAGPVRVEAWRDGSLLRLRPVSQEFADCGASHVKIRSRWTWEGVTADAEADMEYDGMLSVRMAVGGTGRVDRLELVVPLLDRTAPLGHFCGERLRHNFAGYVPSGTGVVWHSGQTRKLEILSAFCPYIWLGAEERGLCWFAESDREWVVRPGTPCQQIERDGGTLTLRVRMIQLPTEITTASVRTFRFGMQATPVKPMPEKPAHWRTWTDGPAAPGAFTFSIAASSPYYGAVWHEPYPVNRNLAVWDKIAEARRAGKADPAFADTWLAQYPADALQEKGEAYYLRHVKAGIWLGSRQPDRYLTYVQGRAVTFSAPEFNTFQDEWTRFDYNSRVWPQGSRNGISYDVEPVLSWQDFNLWWLKRQMEHFSDGLYFDNFFGVPVSDRVLAEAYVLPDGRIQPAVPLGNMRQMMRRTATMYAEAGRRPMIAPHMTNTALIPVMAFAQYALDWEWHYGQSDFQERWSRDHIRAACLGRQSGCAPVVLAIGNQGNTVEKTEWIDRTFNGVVLTHELIPVWYSANTFLKAEGQINKRQGGRERYWDVMRTLWAMGMGTDSCRTWNYWETEYPLEIHGISSSSILHQGRDRSLLVVTDWGGGGPVSVRIGTPARSLTGGVTATDFETGEACEVRGNTLVFTLKRHDHKIVLLTKDGAGPLN